MNRYPLPCASYFNLLVLLLSLLIVSLPISNALADEIPTSAKEIEKGASSEAIDTGILLYFSEMQYSDLEQGRFLLKLIERLKALGNP